MEALDVFTRRNCCLPSLITIQYRCNVYLIKALLVFFIEMVLKIISNLKNEQNVFNVYTLYALICSTI